MVPLYSGLVATALLAAPVLSMTSYPNEFFTPETVLDSTWVANAKWAQANTIVDAKFVAAQGPWSKSMHFQTQTHMLNLPILAVTSKPIIAPTGDKQCVQHN
jgi:hypothetical protein